jgi:hypothetical protein
MDGDLWVGLRGEGKLRRYIGPHRAVRDLPSIRLMPVTCNLIST